MEAIHRHMARIRKVGYLALDPLPRDEQYVRQSGLLRN